MSPSIEIALYYIALVCVFGGVALAIDDLLIDLLAVVMKARPKRLYDLDLERMNAKPEKRIAIMVANWQEDNVLATMVATNIERIAYSNYTFFLGVYPNDLATLKLAKDLEREFTQVKVVVNTRPGPTTKGQMLNEVVRGILESEKQDGLKYDLFMLQDSEDILHLRALKSVNDATDSYDFVQTPVFSFSVSLGSLVAGTYMDEFSESHTKDLLVRAYSGAAVPSAGVGTAFTRALVLKHLELGRGNLLREDTLTEDYDLGFVAKRNGFRSTFISQYLVRPDQTRDLIATREYFPWKLKASVRQRSRWTLGIIFQGWRNLGWSGSWVDKYFLFRDRRGLLNALCLVMGWTTVGYVVGHWVTSETLSLPSGLGESLFVVPASFNLLNMFYRMSRRIEAVAFAHSWREAAGVPIRWLVGNFISVAAVINASYRQINSAVRGVAPKWEKTVHFLPAHLSRPSATASDLQIVPGSHSGPHRGPEWEPGTKSCLDMRI